MQTQFEMELERELVICGGNDVAACNCLSRRISECATLKKFEAHLVSSRNDSPARG